MFRQLFDPESSTYTYLLVDEPTREAVIVDPVLSQVQRDLELLRELAVRLVAVVDTHVHADHVTAASALRADTGAKTMVGAECHAAGYDRPLAEGDRVRFGGDHLQVITTPGHTPGSCCFLWVDRLLTGDTLLIGGCGRTDFQNGDAGALWDSVTRKLFTLPDHTIVLPGHDYHGRTHSTIGAERRSNPRFAGHTRESFIAQMAELKLPRPRLIDQAVPRNKLAGQEVQAA